MLSIHAALPLAGKNARSKASQQRSNFHMLGRSDRFPISVFCLFAYSKIFGEANGRSLQLARQTLHYTIIFLVINYQITQHLEVLQKRINFYITRFGLCRFFRFGFCILSRSPRRRGPHHTHRSEKISSFAPFRIKLITDVHQIT